MVKSMNIVKRLAGLKWAFFSIVAWLLTGCGNLLPQGVVVAPPVATDASLRTGLPKVVVQSDGPSGYRLAVNDELDIKFTDQSDFDERVRIRPDGNISLQLVGSVRAEGLTPAELAAELRGRFRGLAEGVGNKEYLIQPDDIVEIKFTYRAELNEKQRVRPDGKMLLPLVNTVVAEGKTPERLSSELRSLYSKHLRIPDLVVVLREAALPVYRRDGREVRAGLERVEPTVIVRSFALPQVFVGGEVARPGVMNHRRSLTLMQALIEAGGHKPSGEMRSVLVLRKSNAAQPLVIRRNLLADLESPQTNDIVLEPYDVVVIPKTAAANLAEILEQNVFNILPFIKNSAFSFLYQVNRTETKVVP